MRKIASHAKKLGSSARAQEIRSKLNGYLGNVPQLEKVRTIATKKLEFINARLSGLELRQVDTWVNLTLDQVEALQKRYLHAYPLIGRTAKKWRRIAAKSQKTKKSGAKHEAVTRTRAKSTKVEAVVE